MTKPNFTKGTPIDLMDVTVAADVSQMLVITHKKSAMKIYISPQKLNAWLLRQLRNELISTEGKL